MPAEPHPPRNRFERRPRLSLLAVLMAEALSLGALAEGLARWAPFDWYAAELRRNASADLAPGDRRPTVLVMGDSFSADPEGWVAALRAGLAPQARTVGSGVSGFTSRQMARLLPRRLAAFRPRAVVLQLYAGNDLLELGPPVSWRHLSPLRNLLWAATAVGLEAPRLLNYRAGQAWGALARRVRGGPPADRAALEARPFAPALYAPRERLLLRAEPGYVEDQVRLQGRYGRALPEYLAELAEMTAQATAAGARVLVLVVPHPAQVAARYRTRFESLGGRFSGAPLDGDYPLLRALAAGLRSTPARLLDPLPALAAGERAGQELYRHHDEHLSEAGERVLAEVVRQALLELEPRLQSRQ